MPCSDTHVSHSLTALLPLNHLSDTDLPKKRSNHGASPLTNLWNVPVSFWLPFISIPFLCCFSFHSKKLVSLFILLLSLLNTNGAWSSIEYIYNSILTCSISLSLNVIPHFFSEPEQTLYILFPYLPCHRGPQDLPRLPQVRVQWREHPFLVGLRGPQERKQSWSYWRKM